MLKKLGAAVCSLVLLLGGVDLARSYVHQREKAALETVRGRMLDGYVASAEVWGRADTLVLGDSILAGAPIQCGKVFPMTVPTVTSSEMIRRGRLVADHIKPRVVVISLGTNDAFQKEIAADLEQVRLWPEKVLWIEPATAPKIAQRVQNIANDRQEWTYRYTGRTTDGVHPDLEGRREIQTTVSAQCQQLIGIGSKLAVASAP